VTGVSSRALLSSVPPRTSNARTRRTGPRIDENASVSADRGAECGRARANPQASGQRVAPGNLKYDV